MAEGVAQVQKSAASGAFGFFALVAGDDAGLDGDVAGDQFAEGAGLACGYGVGGGLHPAEQVGVAEVGAQHGVLHALGQTGAEGAIIKGGESSEIGEDADGLVERADHVLLERAAELKVDSGLAADAGIDHGEKRGGALND